MGDFSNYAPIIAEWNKARLAYFNALNGNISEYQNQALNNFGATEFAMRRYISQTGNKLPIASLSDKERMLAPYSWTKSQYNPYKRFMRY